MRTVYIAFIRTPDDLKVTVYDDKELCIKRVERANKKNPRWPSWWKRANFYQTRIEQ